MQRPCNMCFSHWAKKMGSSACSYGKRKIWIKMLSTMFDQRRETLKAHWVKRSKIVQKRLRNMNQKINHSKHDIWSLSFTFRFSARKSQSQQNLSKKITHFTIQFFPKNLTRFTNLNSLNSVKNILRQHS